MHFSSTDEKKKLWKKRKYFCDSEQVNTKT